MRELFKEAKKLISEVKQINEGFSKMGDQFEVNGYTVRIFKKPGRTLMDCTCNNSTMFINESPLCKHKISVLGFILKDDMP
jgi:hypothetical protein